MSCLEKSPQANLQKYIRVILRVRYRVFKAHAKTYH